MTTFRSFFKGPRKTAQEKREARRGPQGYRAPRRRTNGSNSPLLAIPKGPTIAEAKQAKEAALNAQIATTRRAVWRRSSVCEICGDTERETAGKCFKAAHEMHERVLRSATRNRPPAERYNTSLCLRACYGCHHDLHNKVIRIAVADEAVGMDGPYDVLQEDRRRRWTVRRHVERTW